jgi:hypothetical protein
MKILGINSDLNKAVNFKLSINYQNLMVKYRAHNPKFYHLLEKRTFTVNSHLKAHAPILGGTLYRRMQPTAVIFSLFVTGALRYRCTNVTVTMA